MRYPGFLGSMARAQSPIAAGALLRNWYYEPSPQFALAQAALYPVAGSTLLATVDNTGHPALFSENGRTFAVVGTGFYEETAANTWTPRGTVTAGTTPPTIASNGAGGQLFITSGGDGFCYVLATNTLTKVLTGEATMGAAVDSYVLALNRATGHIRISGPNDATFPDPTLYFGRSAESDPAIAMVVDGRRQIWVIGEKTGEVWTDTGAYPVPFELAAGSVFPFGTAAAASVAVVADSVCWLAQNKDGLVGVVEARGYNPEVISSFAVDDAFRKYLQAGTTISDALALALTSAGHGFYVLTVPAGDSWAYDTRTGEWHLRSSWDTTNARDIAWRPRAHCYSNGRHLVAFDNSGQIAQLDETVGTEADGRVIRRERIPPALWAENDDVTVDRLEVIAEPGLGTATGQGSDPQIALQVSINGGKTWSAERLAGAGKQGEYGKRAFWLMCGAGPIWQPRIVCTDPIPWRLLECVVEATGVVKHKAA